MKKIIFTVAGILPLLLFAQRVDLDRFQFTAQFRSLPQIRLDSSYHTYNVKVEGTRLMSAYLQDMTPEKSVELQGWRMLPDAGHITVDVKLEDLLPESVSVKERTEVIRDKKGKEVGTRKLYSQEVVYTFSAYADVRDYKGAHIKSFQLANRNYKQVYKSPEFAIRKMAEGYFLLNTFTVTDKLYKNCVNRAMNQLSDQLTDNFGFADVTVTDHMWILDSRKHYEYSAHRNAFVTAKEILFGLRADKTLDGVREQLEPVIKYFNDVKKRYVSTSKHDRKLRYASYYNLAVIYYYLDDPQAMLKEASGLIMNDFDARDGKKFEATAIRLQNLFAETKINTRHFAIDTASFRGPNEATVIAVK